MLVGALKKNSQIWLILLITACGIVLRIVLWQLEPTQARDAVFYLNCAAGKVEFAKAVSADAADTTAPPLLVNILRLFYQAGWNAEYAGVMQNILLGGLLVPLGFLIVLLLSGHDCRLAMGTAWLLALHPVLGDFSHMILRETPYLFSVFCAVCCALWAVTHHAPGWYSGAGGFTAVGILFRWEALEMLPLWGGAWLLAMLMIRERRRELIVGLGWFTVGFLIALLPLIEFCSGWNEYRQSIYQRFARLFSRF